MSPPPPRAPASERPAGSVPARADGAQSRPHLEGAGCETRPWLGPAAPAGAPLLPAASPCTFLSPRGSATRPRGRCPTRSCRRAARGGAGSGRHRRPAPPNPTPPSAGPATSPDAREGVEARVGHVPGAAPRRTRRRRRSWPVPARRAASALAGTVTLRAPGAPALSAPMWPTENRRSRRRDGTDAAANSVRSVKRSPRILGSILRAAENSPPRPKPPPLPEQSQSRMSRPDDLLKPARGRQAPGPAQKRSPRSHLGTGFVSGRVYPRWAGTRPQS